jgi:Zn-finger nucleic acid-binding protein
MKCPNCSTTLLMSDKHGVEIDYCPDCRGIWLDKGELEKIIERETSMSSSQSNKNQYNDDNDDHYNKKQHYDGNYRQKKNKGFLGELFDF